MNTLSGLQRTLLIPSVMSMCALFRLLLLSNDAPWNESFKKRIVCVHNLGAQQFFKGAAQRNIFQRESFRGGLMFPCLAWRVVLQKCKHKSIAYKLCVCAMYSILKQTFSGAAWKQNIYLGVCTVSRHSHSLCACVQYLDCRGGDLEVVQSPEGALSICEVGSRQLMEQLQGHHRAVAVAFRLLIEPLLVQEDGQWFLSCGSIINLLSSSVFLPLYLVTFISVYWR